MADKKKTRCLIMTADTGYGHRSAAKAIHAALEQDHADTCRPITLNPLDDSRTPRLLHDMQDMYDDEIEKHADRFKLLYDATDTQLTNHAVQGGLVLSLLETLMNLLNEYEPDVIIVTHPFYLAPLRGVFRFSRHNIPVITVITDLVTIHRLWFHPVSDVLVVPTDAAHKHAVEDGFPTEKIRKIGIPVHPRVLSDQREKSVIRDELGWDQDLTTLLVVGSKRVQGLAEKLRGINHANLPVQFVLVAGGSDELYAAFEQTEWHVPVHTYNFVDNLPSMMRAADCILTKAGGLITSEALASGLPIILVDVNEGQETGNATYIIDGGAAEGADDPLEVLEIFYHWLQDDRGVLHERAQAAAKLGNPTAAHDIAKLALRVSARFVRKRTTSSRNYHDV